MNIEEIQAKFDARRHKKQKAIKKAQKKLGSWAFNLKSGIDKGIQDFNAFKYDFISARLKKYTAQNRTDKTYILSRKI